MAADSSPSCSPDHDPHGLEDDGGHRRRDSISAHNDDGGAHDDGGSGPRKRRRIPVACSWCRARKSRCDGQRPKCSSCEAQEIECVYAQNPPAANATVPKVFLDLVEARLSAVERDMRSMKSGRAAPAGTFPSPPTSLGRDDLPDRTAAASSTMAMNGGSQNPDGSMANNDAIYPVTTPDRTDGVGTMEFDVDEDSASYFGPSSNIAFTRIVRRSAAALWRDTTGGGAFPRPNAVTDDTPRAGNSPTHGPRALPPESSLAVSRPPSPVSNPAASVSWLSEGGSVVDKFYVPPEEETTRLIRRFFADTGLLFPYIHEESFWRAYVSARASRFRRVKQSWLGLLNMILAMATSTDNNSAGGTGDTPTSAAGAPSNGTERTAAADVFLARAKGLCLASMMGGATVETVQVMLLVTQYLQGTQRSIKTWTVHGLAVKACFQLGLHSEEALKRFSPLERELRIRVWYGAIILDRTLSMTFGRPPSIPDHYIRVSRPSHYLPSPDTHSTAPLSWSGEENSTLFFNATISLYQIMHKVITTLYDCNLGVSNVASLADLASSTLQIEQQLLSWQATLPAALKLTQPEELLQQHHHRNSTYQQPNNTMLLPSKFRVILTLRYHNLRILAHRPILDRYLQLLHGGSGSASSASGGAGGPIMDPHEAAMLWQVGHRSKSTCLQSSEVIIGIVHHVTQFKGPERGMLGAWWFSLYYTFNAALTVVGLLLSDDVSPLDVEPQHQANAAVAERQKHVLDQAIACLPQIDGRNSVIDKCTRFLGGLRYCVSGLPRSRNPNNNNNNNNLVPSAAEGPPALQFTSPGGGPVPMSNGHPHHHHPAAGHHHQTQQQQQQQHAAMIDPSLRGSQQPQPPPPPQQQQPPTSMAMNVDYMPPEFDFGDMGLDIGDFMMNPTPGFMNTSLPTGDLFW